MSQRYVTAAFLNGWARRLIRDKSRVSDVRVRRGTEHLDALRDFYGAGLGLTELGRLDGDGGQRDISLGLPDGSFVLEFTQWKGGGTAARPVPEVVLVLHFEAAADVRAVVERLTARGYPAIVTGEGATVEDPDGWAIVLAAPRAPDRILSVR